MFPFPMYFFSGLAGVHGIRKCSGSINKMCDDVLDDPLAIRCLKEFLRYERELNLKYVNCVIQYDIKKGYSREEAEADALQIFSNDDKLDKLTMYVVKERTKHQRCRISLAQERLNHVLDSMDDTYAENSIMLDGIECLR